MKTGLMIDWLIPYGEGAKTHQEVVNSKISFDAERLAAGQTEYAGFWRPQRPVNTLSLTRLLDDRYAPVLEPSLRPPTAARHPR